MNKDTFPGRWDISSAGHVESSSSSPKHTAMSELAEELGIDDVSEDELKLAFVVPAEQTSIGGCNAYEHVHFLVMRDDYGDGVGGTKKDFSLGTAEVSEVRWANAWDVIDALRSGNIGYAPRTTSYVDAMEGELVKIIGPRRSGT
jgi:isopentenyldiphosphate isomerase